MTLKERFDAIWYRAAGIKGLAEMAGHDANEKHAATLSRAMEEWADDVLRLSDALNIEELDAEIGTAKATKKAGKVAP